MIIMNMATVTNIAKHHIERALQFSSLSVMRNIRTNTNNCHRIKSTCHFGLFKVVKKVKLTPLGSGKVGARPVTQMELGMIGLTRFSSAAAGESILK